MEYELHGKGEIHLFPANRIEEILQNVRMILSTTKGTVPLDRKLGVSSRSIDEPEQLAMMRLRMEIVTAVREYEPRAEITEIEFEPDLTAAADGRLLPKVRLKILDESI